MNDSRIDYGELTEKLKEDSRTTKAEETKDKILAETLHTLRGNTADAKKLEKNLFVIHPKLHDYYHESVIYHVTSKIGSISEFYGKEVRVSSEVPENTVLLINPASISLTGNLMIPSLNAVGEITEECEVFGDTRTTINDDDGKFCSLHCKLMKKHKNNGNILPQEYPQT